MLIRLPCRNTGQRFKRTTPTLGNSTLNSQDHLQNLQRRGIAPSGRNNERRRWPRPSFFGCHTWHHVSAESSRDVPPVLMDEWAYSETGWWFPQLGFRHLWHNSCAKMKTTTSPPPFPNTHTQRSCRNSWLCECTHASGLRKKHHCEKKQLWFN